MLQAGVGLNQAKIALKSVYGNVRQAIAVAQKRPGR
jgi:hypothetical protein